jgi:hypothetical protein
MYNKGTILYIILVSALIEVAIRKPINPYSISFVICPAAFENSSIGFSVVLSYSMHLILLEAAIIFVPLSIIVDARPALQAILIISLVGISVYKCCDSIAMREII